MVRPLFTFLLVFFLIGCSKSEFPLAAVKGRVTCNGQPVKDVIVAFEPVGDDPTKANTGKSGTGRTDEEGYYTISTYGEDDGAIVGTHKVALQLVDPAAKIDCPVPGDLRREVKEGSNTIDFQLPLDE